MTRTLIIAALLLSLPAVTDALVDHQFHREPERNVGYTKADRDGLTKLVELVTAKPAVAASEGRYRLEIPFGCDDKACLTAWAERPHPKMGKRS